MTAKTEALGFEYRKIRIRDLVESPFNPRRHFDADKLKELAESIAKVGLQQPIVVRPKNGKMEIVAGARRYRAAKLAKIDAISARVVYLTDREVLEVQIVENLQREDISALEEADGFQALMKEAKVPVEKIAEQVGKSKEYIYGRVKLRALIPEAKKALAQGEMEPGHGILIARLRPEDQRRSLKLCLMKEHEEIFDHRSDDTMNALVAPTVKDLADWIQQELHTSVAAAPWTGRDEPLVKGVPACAVCPKLAGNMTIPPPGAKKKTCTDTTCYESKFDHWVDKTIAALKEKGVRAVRISEYHGRPKPGALPRGHYRTAGRKKKCKSYAKGITVQGSALGKIVDICTNNQCRTHNPHLSPSTSKKQQARQAAADKTRKKREARDRAVRRSTFQAIIKKAPPHCQGRILVELAYEVVGQGYSDRDMQKEFGLANLKGTAVRRKLQRMDQRKLIGIVISQHIEHALRWGNFNAMVRWAKAVGVSIPAVKKQVLALEKEEATKAAAAKKKKPKSGTAKGNRGK